MEQEVEEDLGVEGKAVEMSSKVSKGVVVADKVVSVVVDEAREDEPRSHPIMQTIKDAVHKVVNVFRPQNVSSLVETLNTSSLEGASLRFRLKPEAGDKYDQDVINR